MKTPEITIEKRAEDGPMAYVALWQDDTHRYHVWLDPSGPSKNVIYKNRIEKNPGEYTAHLDLLAKTHEAAHAQIVALMGGSARAEADAAYARKQAEKQAERERDITAAAQRVLRHLADRLGMPALAERAATLTFEEAVAIDNLIR